MSLYSDYLNELGYRKIIEQESGFIVYTIVAPECFIEEMYVKPEVRLSNIASSLENQAILDAKSNGCTFIGCTVVMANKQPSESLRAILARGYKLRSSNQYKIYLAKEI